MDTGKKHGPVSCPYCGHEIVERVKYAGQALSCQKCTSASRAPTYSESLDPAYLARKETELRRHYAARDAADKAQEAYADEHFSGGWSGCAVLSAIMLVACLVELVTGRTGARLDALIGFFPCLAALLVCLLLGVPRKYYSEAAKRRIQSRREMNRSSSDSNPPADEGN